MICIERIPTGKWKANCYIVYCKESDSCIVIDPGGDAERIASAIRASGRGVSAFFATHGHYDHIDAAGDLQADFNASLWLSKKDSRLFGQMNFYRRLFDGLPTSTIPSKIEFFEDDVQLAVANLHIDVINCPGHTNGSVSILIEDVIFTGDTLLKNKFGDHHFPESDELMLQESVRRLLQLPPDTRIFPGHGPPTFVRDEKHF